MATPDFIRELRVSAGHQLLWLPGVTALVFDERGRVLLNRRSDTRRWSVIGGIPEPGEQPAACAVREVYEETAIRCAVERVVLVRALGGEARVNDDESLEVGWFAVDALPDLNEFALFRIKQAMSDGPTWFDATDCG
jgi:ADP-ribose pyrophosphatase YjhB (NUDIX family)